MYEKRVSPQASRLYEERYSARSHRGCKKVELKTYFISKKSG